MNAVTPNIGDCPCPRKQLNEHLAANLYYQREDNERGRPGRINTIAVQFELRMILPHASD